MRLGYFGPEGTFTEEALRASAPPDAQAIPYATIPDVAAAVTSGEVERGLVPIENSLEGSVNATLDVLIAPGGAPAIVGETVLAVTQCLIARPGVELDAIEVVISHPHALAQCAGFLRRELGSARTLAASSTSEAARMVAASDEPWAAIGPRRAAQITGTEVLRAAIEDGEGNETRFVWLAVDGQAPPFEPVGERFKTSIVFAGDDDERPGWLVACLTELSSRAVNLTKIESRPRRGRLGHYLFLADLDGAVGAAAIDQAIAALRGHCQELRVLGSYPAARMGGAGSVH
jgi:prephenate dehydratase